MVMANRFSLSVIGKGVENTHQHQPLHELGRAEVQGCLLSIPLAEDEMTTFLAPDHRFAA